LYQYHKTCDDIWDDISLVIDGEADEQTKLLVERHLAECAECVFTYRILQDSARILLDEPEIAPPSGLRNSILNATVYRPSFMERIQRELSRWTIPAKVGSFSMGLAAAALLWIFVPNQGVPHFDPLSRMVPQSSGIASNDEAQSSDVESPQVDNKDVAGGISTKLPVSVNSPVATPRGTIQSTSIKFMPAGQKDPRIKGSVMTQNQAPKSDDTRIARSPILSQPNATSPSEPEEIEPPEMRESVRTPVLEVARNEAAVIMRNSPVAGSSESHTAEPSAAPSPRIMLVSGSDSNVNGAATTLADLRSSLKHRDVVHYSTTDLTLIERRQMWDVYRSRF